MVSIKKKTTELVTLCGIKVCTIVFGPNGEINSWPENPADVRTMIGMYKNMSNRTLKIEATTGTESRTNGNLDEKFVNLEREIADTKRENWRKIMRLMEAMNQVVSDRIEFLKAVDEQRQSKKEEEKADFAERHE